jgi:hypothetical protein
MEKFLFFLANLQDFLIGGIIVACAVIVLMGILKKAVFNRITNKLARKCALSGASLVLVLPISFFFMVGSGLDFQYYWILYAVNAFFTVITYWLYENTGLRNLIALLGGMVLKKYASVMYSVIEGAKNDDTKTKLVSATTELKQSVKKVAKTVKEDESLKDL